MARFRTMSRENPSQGPIVVTDVPTRLECFSPEIRALAIAIFYALETDIGGVLVPFGIFIENGSCGRGLGGYLFSTQEPRNYQGIR